MNATFTYGDRADVVVDAHEIKANRHGRRYPERVVWIVLDRSIPGFGREGLVRMSDIKVKETR